MSIPDFFNEGSYREPTIRYAEAKSYLDAMDHIDFLMDEFWQVLVPPFVIQTEKIFVEKLGQIAPECVERPILWGFVVHRFYE